MLCNCAEQRELSLTIATAPAARAHRAATVRIRNEEEPTEAGDLHQLGEAAQDTTTTGTLGRRKRHGAQSHLRPNTAPISGHLRSYLVGEAALAAPLLDAEEPPPLLSEDEELPSFFVEL